MIIFILALFSVAQAGELKFSSSDYDTAEKAANYFKFIGHSRKLGIIGTSFDGYAKEAMLSFDRKGKLLKKVRLIMPVAALDTDNESRNEKMHVTCLSVSEFPEVKINIKDPIDLGKDSQSVAASMEVRGKTVPLEIHLEKTEENLFKGTSSFKLSEAQIPDPSIAIASVKDEFELEFQVDVAALK